ncbi:MAG: response regulator [Rhodospirillales bacterium]|nr:response regulator [Rhodospirillales bacterium]
MALILLVDDEFLVRYSMRMMLEAGGHDVNEAPNGEEALAQLAEHPCDVLIVDLVMPSKDGVETILEVRKRYPDLPIIAISGGGPAGRIDRLDAARLFGADAALAKPFTEALLNGEVDKLLRSLDDATRPDRPGA